MKKQKTTILFYWVDAFTDEPFHGNPATVCILTQPLSPTVMQSLAAEIGLSETAFVHSTEGKTPQESAKFSLRWFTPKVEVKLCGHATLASAAVLFQEVGVSAKEVSFETKSGRLSARQDEHGVSLDFPAETLKPAKADTAVLNALGIDAVEAVQFSERLGMLLLRVSGEDVVRRLQPDFDRLKATQNKETSMGVIVTARGNGPFDFVSRFFGPQLGINEDPVTGSSHSVLTPYWSRILAKREMLAYQASARGGKLRVRLRSDNRVDLVGEAFILIRGALRLPHSLS
ncbi:MAG: PhzF family phenazine biosynthesis protein [Candidatus Bathyarchaeia archaeon]